MNNDKLIGVTQEILADPRVQEAMGKVQSGIEQPAAQALTKDPTARLAKYGLKLRVSGLQHQAIIARIMASCPRRLKKVRDTEGNFVLDADGQPILTLQLAIPDITKMLIWLYTIAAPWSDVMGAVSSLEEDGFDVFNDTMDDWFAEHKLTGEALTDAIIAMGEVSALARKISGATDDTGGTSEIPKA